MNLLRIWCALFLALLQPLSAYYFDAQLRVGGYYATSRQTKKAFENGIPVYSLEASAFFSEPWEWVPWKAWMNCSFMAGNGKSENLGRTSSNLTTLSIGLKHSWMLDACGGQFYLGGGPSVSWLRMKTHRAIPEGFWDGSWHGHRKISKKNWGFVAKSGFQMLLWNYVLADVFCDYQVLAVHYKNFSKRHLHHAVSATNKVHKHSRKTGHHRLDLNGFVFGGALGVCF